MLDLWIKLSHYQWLGQSSDIVLSFLDGIKSQKVRLDPISYAFLL